MQYDDEVIPTESGTPQGSCLSSTLWNCYIADLGEQLDKVQSSNLYGFLNANSRLSKATSRFFADDLMVFCEDKSQLEKAWSIIDRLSQANFIKINRNESAVLELRVDPCTPRPIAWDFHGIPLVKEYKYLRIIITDTLKFKLNS